MNSAGLVVCIALCVLSIVEKRAHNEKLNQYFPDESDPKQSDIRRDLESSMYMEVLFLIGCSVALIASIIGKLVK